MRKIPVLILLSLIVSCTNKSNSQLILGSWSLHVAKANFVMNFNFINSNTLIVNFKENNKDEIHTLSYKLVNNEKRLVATEKISGTDEFDIARLSANNLILIKGNDTLDFKRD